MEQKADCQVNKEGNLTVCVNWREITFISVATQVGRVLIIRMSKGEDSRLRKEQANYTKGTSTAEQISFSEKQCGEAQEWTLKTLSQYLQGDTLEDHEMVSLQRW